MKKYEDKHKSESRHTELKQKLEGAIAGEVEDSEQIIDEYSRDTSIFKVPPELVVFPKNTDDLCSLVKFASENKGAYPDLSLTGRSAGTCMTGGPLSESLVLGFTRYFDEVDVDEENMTATVEPGVYYRDFEKEILPEHLSYPPYPASRSIAAMGGIVMNDSGGERSLRYGKTHDFVDGVSMVLADGNEYEFGAISEDELEGKKKQEDFEGEVYRRMDELVSEHAEVIERARPAVSKNSSGYRLWDVKKDGQFDLSKLFVGSQGTLGLLASAKVRLVKEKPHKKMLALFFKDWDHLPEVVEKILPYEPDTLETFDDDTMKLGLRFLPDIAKKSGRGLISFALHFLPEVWVGVKMLGMPKLVVLVELAEESEEEAERKAAAIQAEVEDTPGMISKVLPEDEQEKYWVMRRQSFNLLRQKVKGKDAAPFVEDFCVDPDKIPEFLPKMLGIMKDHGVRANLAGHAGNGNFHTIPLLDLSDERERGKIIPVMDKLNKLTVEYGGTISAEHNDGILRTPYLSSMFEPEYLDLMQRVKDIFDPDGIFNPGKKVAEDGGAGTKEYLQEHISPHED